MLLPYRQRAKDWAFVYVGQMLVFFLFFFFFFFFGVVVFYRSSVFFVCFRNSTVVILLFILRTETKKCRWSNEGCSLNDDCCSGSCVQQHEGTDPRCEKSAIHFPCFYSYQCEDGLACGNQYSCCSPFWGVCSDNGDCCEMKHVCRPEEGFIYKRCLMPSRSNMVFLSRQLPVVLATMHIIYYVY